MFAEAFDGLVSIVTVSSTVETLDLSKDGAERSSLSILQAVVLKDHRWFTVSFAIFAVLEGENKLI